VRPTLDRERAVFALRSRLAPRAGRLWPWLPALFAAAYLVILLTSLRSVVQGIFLNADSASALTIGELYSSRGADAHVTLGNFPWYSTLWFEDLTRGLPAHRDIWQVAPWLVSLLGVGMVAWSTVKAAGRWAGTMAGLLLACAGPGLLVFQFSWSIHAWTYFHACLLGLFLVLWADRGGQVGRRPVHVLLAIGLTAATAVGLASDRLLLPAGLAPFLVGAIALAVLLPRPVGLRIGVSAAAVTAGSLVGAAIIRNAMEAANVRAFRFELVFAQWDHIAPNVRLSAQSLAFLFNGDFGGAKVDAKSLLTFACAVAILGGLLAAARYLRPWVREARQAAVRGSRGELAAHPARMAHVVFWGLAGAIMLTAFILSDAPVDRFTSRYIITVGYAIAALAPLAAVAWGVWARVALVVGLCTIITGSAAAMVRREIQDNPTHFLTPAETGPLVRLAEEQRMRYGYAGYWDAAPLTWQGKGAIEVYPVKPCAGRRACPFPFHQISTWYRPRRGVRTFLVSDSSQPMGVIPAKRLGPPKLVRFIGPRLTVRVYDYDIASRFGP
jgi:hypothetical protein